MKSVVITVEVVVKGLEEVVMRLGFVREEIGVVVTRSKVVEETLSVAIE